MTRTWNVETSHLVAVPRTIEAASLESLQDKLQHIADTKQVRSDRPPIGQLTFKEQRDNEGRIFRVNSFFTDQHGSQRRFMRVGLELEAV